MQIEITTGFVDRQATDPDKADVEAGTKMTVTAERGAELIGLGLAIDATPKSKPSSPKRPAAKRAPAKRDSASAAGKAASEATSAKASEPTPTTDAAPASAPTG